MDFVLPKARALVARSVHIKIRPTPQTFSERREVLRVLERFGEVVAFKSFKYHYTHPVHNAFSALFTTEASAAEVIRRSPIRYRLTSEAVQPTEEIEYSAAPVVRHPTISSTIQPSVEPSKTVPVPVQQQTTGVKTPKQVRKQAPTWGRSSKLETQEEITGIAQKTDQYYDSSTAGIQDQDKGPQQVASTKSGTSQEFSEIKAQSDKVKATISKGEDTFSVEVDTPAQRNEDEGVSQTARFPPLGTAASGSSDESKTYSKVFELSITTAVFDHLRYIKEQAMHGPFVPVSPNQSYIASSLKESVPESLWSDGLLDWETEGMKWRKDMVFEQAAGFDHKDDVTAAWRIAARRRKAIERDTPEIMKDLAGVARRYQEAQNKNAHSSEEG